MPEISNRPITPSQVRAIHVALSRQRIDDADYRARLRSGWGVTTSKALTRRQASELLEELRVPLPRPPGAKAERPPRPRRRAAPGTVVMVSPAQRRLIGEIAAEIDWRASDGYARWLRSSFGLERVSTSADAARVINGLRAMRRRAGGGA